MKVLQINISVNTGSTGRIASLIGELLIKKDHDSYIIYGRETRSCNSVQIKIGSQLDQVGHILKTRLFDLHGFGSARPTRKLVKEVERINPDIIHLHNIHGYYLHIGILFDYLKRTGRPVVWTLHDCWPFTGHCSHFQRINCIKWKAECFKCPNTHGYPASWLMDNSRKNFHRKRKFFNGLKKMTIVSPSIWLADQLKESFLSDYKIKVINNGVNLEKFYIVDSMSLRSKYNLGEKYILGIANKLTKRKGFGDFIELRKILDPGIQIVLAGLEVNQLQNIPNGIKGIPRIENTEELAMLYSGAKALVNPTYVDNFPSVNLESLSCGTPVITYNTGGSPEAIDANTGVVVEKGDIKELANGIIKILQSEYKYSKVQCRARAEKFYSSDDRYSDYLRLYQEILNS